MSKGARRNNFVNSFFFPRLALYSYSNLHESVKYLRQPNQTLYENEDLRGCFSVIHVGLTLGYAKSDSNDRFLTH